MQPGKLNCLVMLQAAPTGQDEIGEPAVLWTDVGQVWADIRHPGGLEAIRADSPTSIGKASVRIRLRPGVASGMRFEFKGRFYNIENVLPDEHARGHLDCACEVVNVAV